MTNILELSGGRELVNLARAKELLEKISVTDPTSIKLSNKSFDHEAAQIIADKVSQYHQITDADLSDIIAGRPEEEALKVLETICDR